MNDEGGGTGISYTNGVIGISYDRVENVLKFALVGDVVLLCLVEVPENCPLAIITGGYTRQRISGRARAGFFLIVNTPAEVLNPRTRNRFKYRLSHKRRRAPRVVATSSTLIDIWKVVFMGRRGPAGLSITERADLWSRWKAGFHVREIARAFERDHGSIRNLLLQQGGIGRPVQTGGKPKPMLRCRDHRGRGSSSVGLSIAHPSSRHQPADLAADNRCGRIDDI